MHQSSKGKVFIGVGIALVIALIGARLYLPVWATGYVNRQIDALEGYSGGVDDIDIHLWRGAYAIHGLSIRKREADQEQPFVAARAIDLSVEWPALLRGALVAEIDIHNARLNFSRSQDGAGAGWGHLVDQLTPLAINRLTVQDSEVRYTDYTAEPALSLFIENLNANITNLRQVEQKQTRLPSQAEISGRSIGNGALTASAKMNILKEIPDFDASIALKQAELRQLNDYLERGANVAFEQGEISVFAEFAAADGHLTGYVKPVASAVKVDQGDDATLEALWRSVVAFFVFAFKNHAEDQFAMRIPIEGSLDNPDEDLWSTLLSIFSNAFGNAFTKREDGTIDFNDALRVSAPEASD